MKAYDLSLKGGEPMKVKEVMTTDVITVPPTASLRTAARLMVVHGISGLPVVDDGKLVGVLSEHDFVVKEQGQVERSSWLRWLTSPIPLADEAKLDARCVGDAMTAPAITIGAWVSVATAARRMLEENVKRLVVVRDGQLAGIVTRRDLVKAFARSDREIEEEIRREVLPELSFWAKGATFHVEVTDGNVTISGRSPVRLDPAETKRYVARVPGVVSVSSEIESLA